MKRKPIRNFLVILAPILFLICLLLAVPKDNIEIVNAVLTRDCHVQFSIKNKNKHGVAVEVGIYLSGRTMSRKGVVDSGSKEIPVFLDALEEKQIRVGMVCVGQEIPLTVDVFAYNVTRR